MGIVFKNNAKTTLSSNISNSATSIAVTDGSVFPSLNAGEFFLCTFDDGSNNEIVKCTARSSNTLTVIRAQESTTARAFSAADACEGRVTAGVLETIQENIAAKSANQTVYNATTASSATAYNVGTDPQEEANAMVFLNGVMQHHDTFSFSGSTLTFDAAPSDGLKLEVIIDNLINLQSSNLTVDSFTATSGQTAFTLTDVPAAEDNLLVFIEGVFQNQDAYSFSGTTLTMSAGVTLNRKVVVYIINPVNIGTPSDGTVTSAKLSGNITTPGNLTVGAYDVSFDSPTFVVDNANSRVGIGTSTPSMLLDITGDTQHTGHILIKSQNELRFYEAANYVGFEAPALSANQIWVLPAADGSANQMLKTDGSGNLGWRTDVEGTITSVANMTNNNVITASGSTTLNGEANLTFDGSTLAVTGAITASGAITGNLTGNASGTALTVTQAAQTAITSLGTLTTLTVDNLTIDGTTITGSGSNDITIDGGGRIDLSADDNGEVRLYDGSSLYGQFKDDSDRFTIQGLVSNADMLFVVNDGGVATTALKLDAANAGAATFYGATTFNALITSTVAAGAGDAVFRWAVAGNETWQMGIDNSDADKLKIGGGTTLGTTDYMTFYGSKIGIGTTSPNTNSKLHVSAASSGQATSSNNTQLTVENSGTAGIQLLAGTSNVGGIWVGDSGGSEDGKIYYSNANREWTIASAGTVAMTIESTNVGIGTASPGANLHVYSAGQAIARVEGVNQYYTGLMIKNNYSSVQSQWHVAAAGGTSGWGATNGNFIIRDDTTNSTGIEIEKGAGGTSGALYIDSIGNVGIGAIPEATETGWTNVSIGGLGTIINSTSANAGGRTQLANNVYTDTDGNYSYISTDEASLYKQIDGIHSWHNAASGSADAHISMSERLRIAADGSLSTPTAGSYNFKAGAGAGIALANGSLGNVILGDQAGDLISTGDYNVAIGYRALDAEDTGSKNTAIGTWALSTLNYDGDGFNVAIGYLAGENINTGVQNTIIGALAGDAISTGYKNIAIGYGAMSVGVVTGNNNVCIGAETGDDITSGWGNVCINSEAGRNIDTGTRNICIGQSSGASISSGIENTYVGNLAGAAGNSNSNVGIGSQCLEAGAHGAGTVAIGWSAGEDLTGTRNTLVGAEAGRQMTSSDDSTAVGHNALGEGIVTGNENTAVGRSAGKLTTSGEWNTYIGAYCGDRGTTARENTLIGYHVDTTYNNSSNVIKIGNNFTGNEANSKVSIGNDSGYIWADFLSSGTWAYVSDRRLKKNIEEDDLGLAFINELKPVTFNWKSNEEIDPEFLASKTHKGNDKDTETIQHSFIAQDVKAAMDKVGNTTFNGWSPDTGDGQEVGLTDFITPLVKAVQELSAEVEQLKQQAHEKCDKS